MKKITKLALIVLGTLALIPFTSCKKEENTVKKQISRVYYSEQSSDWSSPKTLVQQWNWDKDNLLKSIDNYGENGNTELIINFQYNDKKRISRIDCYQYNVSLLYNYNEKDHLFDRLDLYYGNMILGTCAVTYKDKKIDMLTATVYDDYFYKAAALLDPLSALLPKELSEPFVAFEKQLAQRNNDQSYVVNVQFTWQNDNVSQIIASGMGEMISITAQYDNKNCFLYGFLLGQPGGGGLFQNNPTMVIVTESGYSDSESMMATYQYDSSNYPTMMTMYEPESSYQFSLYFEYNQ